MSPRLFHSRFAVAGVRRARQPRSGQPAVLALHIAVAAALAGSAAAVHAQAASGRAAPAPAARSYDIPAGPLQPALIRFSAEAGIYLAGSTDLASGKRSPGLKGRFSAQEGLTALLAGTGLQAVANEQGQYVLKEAPAAGVATLPAIAVTGAEIDPVVQRLNPQTSVASKIPLAQREIPQTVSVVTQQQIQEQNLQSLDEAMKRTPGVMVLQSDADRVQYYARGFPISSMVVDGLPVVMNSDMSSTAGTNAPSLAMYDRVEVLDGPAGLYGGFGSVGGVISLVRKRAPSEFSTQLSTTMGTRDNFAGQADIGGPLNDAGTLRGRFVASAQRKDLEPDSTWRKDQSYYGTLEADLAPGTLLRTGVSYSQRDSNVGWADKVPLYGDLTLAGGRSDFFGAPWNHDRYANTNVFASLEHKLAQDWKVTLAGSFDHNTARVLSGETFGSVDKATNEATFGTTNTDYYENNQSYDLNLTGKYALLGRQHDLVIGANYSRMYNYGTSYYGTDDLFNFQTVNIKDYSYAKPTWSGLPEHTSKGAVEQSQYGIYGNTRYHLTDALTAIVGARVSWWDTRYKQDATYNPFNNQSSSDTYKKKVTPYAGLIADIDDAHSVYASYSTIFQPQALRTPSGELLKPMEGEQYEVGVKGSYLDGRLQTSAALYQVTQTNRALPTDDTSQYFEAAGKARSRGLDLRASGQITPGWTVTAGYTYNDSKLLDEASLDTSASAFSQIAPRHLFRVWSNYRLPGDLSRWEVGGGINATSKLYGGTNDAKITQGGFYTADARLAYKIDEHMTVALNATNLFDRRYITPMTQGALFGEGRRVALTLRANF